MDWTEWKLWKSLQKRAEEYVTTSSSVNPPEHITGINGYVYEVGRLPGRPSIELVFFHGLQPEGSEEAYYTTWLTRDGSELWLDWILESHQNARILLVSYDAFMKRTAEHGNMDMFRTCENLVQDLTESQAVGQDGCPVVLVGHCIGGLVMKNLTVALESLSKKFEFYHPDNRVQNLFLNVRGFFFFGCPNHGSRLADESREHSKGPFLEELTTLNSMAQRGNEFFRDLRRRHRWKAYGVAEGLQTKLGGFEGVLVPEASARDDVDFFYTDCGADHFTVCRLTDKKTSSSFHKFLNFVEDVLEEDKQRHAPEIDFPTKVVGLERRKGRKGPVEALLGELESSKCVAIVGMPGIGKSTLAKKVFRSPQRSYDFTCFLCDVKNIIGDNGEGHLRGEVLKSLSYRGRKVDKSCVWKSLNGKTVLLVLDDVDKASQVPETIESDFSSESNIIVTSREKGFLLRKGFKCQRLEELGKEDSKELFCHHAFGTEAATQLKQDRVDEIIRLLAGLPLGLVVVGGFLRNKDDLTDWDCVRERLSTGQSVDGNKSDGVWSVMEMSYASLGKREQQMFVDIATCFHGESLEHARRAWEHCGWADTLGLRNLEEKNLVTIENTNSRHPGKPQNIEAIRMHEVLRTFGKSNAPLEHDKVNESCRVRYDVSNPLPTIWPFSKGSVVEVLIISCRTLEEMGYRTVKMQDLHGLKELKVLWLDGVSLSGPCSLLPPKLAYMRLSYSEWSSERPFLGLKGSKPGQDSRLRLEIAHCPDLKGILDSVRNLERLKDLQILSCGRSGTPPYNLRQLEAIEYLDITCSDDLKALSDIVVKMRALQKLVIRSTIDHGSSRLDSRPRQQPEFLECRREATGWAVVRHGLEL